MGWGANYMDEYRHFGVWHVLDAESGVDADVTTP